MRLDAAKVRGRDLVSALRRDSFAGMDLASPVHVGKPDLRVCIRAADGNLIHLHKVVVGPDRLAQPQRLYLSGAFSRLTASLMVQNAAGIRAN